MEELCLQYFIITYVDPDHDYDFPFFKEFNTIDGARNFADWLDHNGFADIKFFVQDYL